MVSCHESKSSADMRTASPALELILTGTWSSLTCWMRGNRRERASLALTATASTSSFCVPYHGTRVVQVFCARPRRRTAPTQHPPLPCATPIANSSSAYRPVEKEQDHLLRFPAWADRVQADCSGQIRGAGDDDPGCGCRGYRGRLGGEHGELAAGRAGLARYRGGSVHDPGAVLGLRGRVTSVPHGLCGGRALHAVAAARP